MNLTPVLLQLAKELRLDVSGALWKPELIEATLALEAEEHVLTECLEIIREREAAKRQPEELREQQEREREERELELIRLVVEIERVRTAGQRSEANGAGEHISFKITELMHPYKLGEDIGLFLVNFERTCEKQGFSRKSWPQRLLTLLAVEAAEVIASLSMEGVDHYDNMKSSFLRKYRLSAEAFRRKFREMEKGRSGSYTEFAYKLTSNMVEWLKEEKAYTATT